MGKKHALLLAIGLMVFAPLLYAQQKPKPAPPAATPATATKTPSGIETAVLVLDASGSMSGSVGGLEKMAAAKDAVGQLVAGWDKSVPLGLTAYGHRSSSCTDIESLIPVGPVDATSFMSTVNGLQAKGSTPLTDAVIQAAEQLDYENNQATVILVSDGEESCGGDPCEMAKQLEALGVDFTAHVVGFGVSAEQAESGLACIAQNTGGQYKTASDAASLKAALTGMVKDVEERKVKWRKSCGKHWGKNGRWKSGKWAIGRGDGRRAFWAKKRAKWRKHKKHHRGKRPRQHQRTKQKQKR